MQELFQKNILFFYNNHKEYYDLITNIKTRRFQIKNDNIFDTESGQYLYPIQENESQMFSTSEFYSISPIQNHLWNKYFYTYKLYDYDESTLPITSNIINSFLKESKECDEFNDTGYYFDKNFLPATTIFGIMSGIHIEKLVKKYDFQSLFIYEPNVEFFAISLYFIDYEFMFEKLDDRVFLFIQGNLEEKIIKKFYEERIVTANFVRLELVTYSHPKIEDAKDKFRLANISNKRGWGSYEDEIVGIKNHIKNSSSNIPTLTSTKNYDFPVCVVANGSSLDNLIPFIKENQEKFIIISVGTATKPLLDLGIMSDFHIEIERMPYLVDVLKEFLPNYKGHFVGASVIDNRNFFLNKNSLMFIRDASSVSGEGFKLTYTSPVVGNAGVSFALHFSSEIYLCGFDAGFRKDQKLHAKGSFYDDKDDKSKEAFKVRGNFNDDVYSNSLLNLSRVSLANAISKFDAKVYNLSDGAFIENTIPLKSENFSLTKEIDKEKEIKKILSHFEIVKSKKLDYKKELKIYIKSLKKLLSITPKNREELTLLIDKITDYTVYIYYSNPMAGTLMRGSIWHIMNAFYITMHKVDMKEYNRLSQIILNKLSKFI